MIVSRRRLFGMGAAFVAAPAIVRVASLMPVSAATSVPRFEVNMLPPWVFSGQAVTPVRNALVYGSYGGYVGYVVTSSDWEQVAKEITGVSDLMRG